MKVCAVVDVNERLESRELGGNCRSRRKEDRGSTERLMD